MKQDVQVLCTKCFSFCKTWLLWVFCLFVFIFFTFYSVCVNAGKVFWQFFFFSFPESHNGSRWKCGNTGLLQAWFGSGEETFWMSKQSPRAPRCCAPRRAPRVQHTLVQKLGSSWGALLQEGKVTQGSWAIALLGTATAFQNKNTLNFQQEKQILWLISKHKINASTEQINLIEISLRKTAAKALWGKISSDRNTLLRLSYKLLKSVSPRPKQHLVCGVELERSPPVVGGLCPPAGNGTSPPLDGPASQQRWQAQEAEIFDRSGKSNPAAKRLVLKCLTFSTRAEQIIYLINLVSSPFTSCPGAAAEIRSHLLSEVPAQVCSLFMQLVTGSHKTQRCVDCSWLGVRGRILF